MFFIPAAGSRQINSLVEVAGIRLVNWLIMKQLFNEIPTGTSTIPHQQQTESGQYRELEVIPVHQMVTRLGRCIIYRITVHTGDRSSHITQPRLTITNISPAYICPRMHDLCIIRYFVSGINRFIITSVLPVWQRQIASINQSHVTSLILVEANSTWWVRLYLRKWYKLSLSE